MKKSGGPSPSPKSPRDKVTFAEFKNEVFSDTTPIPIHPAGETITDSELNGILKESHHESPTPPANGTAHAYEGDIPVISICEPSSESAGDTASAAEQNTDFKGTLESVNSDIGEPPSPTNETQENCIYIFCLISTFNDSDSFSLC